MAALAERQQELGLALMGLGYPMKSAAAIVGNGTQENLCLPVTTGPKDHGSDGIFQWRLQRLTNLQTLPGWDTLPVQARFVMLELQAKPGTQFFDMDYHALEADLRAGTKTLETLTLDFTDGYERPSEAGRVPDKRIGYARDALAILEKSGVQPVTPPPPPAPVPYPSPLPGPTAMPPIDPVFIAQIIQILAPLAESLIAGLVKGVITQLSTAAAARAPAGVPSSLPQFPGLPPVDLGQLQATLGPLIQQMIATELAKIGKP